MCGYCTEKIALIILSEESRGSQKKRHLMDDHLGRYFYLRETTYFPYALDRIKRDMIRKKQAMLSEVMPEIVLLRGLEILLSQGFDSPAYQKLIRNPLFKKSIAASCCSAERKYFDSLTEGLEIVHLGLLYDAETFLTAERSKNLLALALALPACQNLLKHYISWWLDGKEIEISGFMAKMGELDIWDRINRAEYADQSQAAAFSRALDYRFSLLVRALYFSILMLGSCSAGKKMLLAVAQRYPAETPGFDCVDLWLQRVGALKLYDMEGFDIFCKHVTTIRATSYYYINLVRGFSIEQKKLLLEEVTRNPDAEHNDNMLSITNWLCDESGEARRCPIK